MAAISASRDKAISDRWSSASRTRISSGRFGRSSRVLSSRPGLSNRSAVFRHMIDFSVSNWWFSTALIVSASSPFRSPVVPKVPSVMWRPARPAIWAISVGRSRRGAWPSNLFSLAKATWSTSMFSPMPMASVATR